ncbi:MAG: RagB/SusD family nutrient uptake outer membrane protein [Rikenellaceae bacterium]
MENKFKNYILQKVVVVIAAISCLASCNYLDKEPDDMLTLDAVFDNASYTEDWLAACYSLVPDPLWGFHTWEGYGYYLLSDESQMASSLSQFGWSDLMNAQQGSWSPTDLLTTLDLWAESYAKIRACLIFIENAKALTSQGLTEATVERYKYEARFLMAYYYTRMLEHFGPVPLVTDLFDVSASTEDLSLPREPYDDMVDYLDEELLELSTLLPTSYSTTNVGRPTNAICLAVRARMLMFAASPLFNGNPDFADMTNPDGTALFSSTYDESKWKRAAEACKDVIDLSGYELYKEYTEDGDLDALMSCINVHLSSDSTTNPEIIFPSPEKTSGYYQYHLLPRGCGWAGCIGTTQNVVDAFFTKNGYTIDEDPTYSETGYSTTDVYYDSEFQAGSADDKPGLVTTAGTFMMYVNREPRFYANIRWNGEYMPFDDTGRNHQFYYGGMDGPSSHDSPLCGYHINKAISPDTRYGVSYPSTIGSIIRLAEIYLSYAEALNEYDPGNAEIAYYVNLIRERAGIPNLSSSLSQDEMREAIVRERRVEFALEGGMRYHDMRRWLIAEEVFKTPISGMNTSGKTDADFFVRTDIQTRTFLKKMYLQPIPQDYIDNNSNLVQNKYW